MADIGLLPTLSERDKPLQFATTTCRWLVEATDLQQVGHGRSPKPRPQSTAMARECRSLRHLARLGVPTISLSYAIAI